MNTSIYVYSTIKSPIKAAHGMGAYLLAWKKPDGTDGTRARLFEMETTASMAEVQLIAAAVKELEAYHVIYEADVYLRNNHAKSALTVYMPEWYRRGWKNAKGEPVSDWYKELFRSAIGSTLRFTQERGEFTSWLEMSVEKVKEKGEKACLLTLENIQSKRLRSGSSESTRRT